MTHVVTPSEVNPITAGQIGKVQDLLGAALRKAGLQSEPMQQVIEHQGEALIAELVAAVRKRVEAISSMIVRHVAINVERTPQQVLDATGRKQYVNGDVVVTMPCGTTPEADVHFFKLDRCVSDDDLEKEYELRGLKPADPRSLAAVNEADPAFADEHPNSTHWKDVNGNWCYAAFNRWFDGGRSVYVHRFDLWFDGSWFAGLRK
ncbi:MAG: hypothetical protein AAB442_02305 [Patescibacteria group bacterium]